MVLVTWRDGDDEKLRAEVVERRPVDFWKHRRKKRKLQKKSGLVGVSGGADNSNESLSLSASNAGATGTSDGKSKLLGVSLEEGDLSGLKADQIQYYVHYVEHDR
jgi:hypothetical protein